MVESERFEPSEKELDEKEKEIRLKLDGNNLTYAILNKTSPIGFNQWQVINDTCNEEYLNYTTTLNFNSCFNTEFIEYFHAATFETDH